MSNVSSYESVEALRRGIIGGSPNVCDIFIIYFFDWKNVSVYDFKYISFGPR